MSIQTGSLRGRFNLRMLATLAGVGAGLVSTAGLAHASDLLERTVVPVQIRTIVDGDTVHAMDADGNNIKVRMHGIDAPELHLSTDQGTFAQLPWAADAETIIQDLVRPGARGELISYGFDKYRRTLGQIVVGGMNVNLEMVKRGAAISYAICAAGDCTEETLRQQNVGEFQAACHSAQTKGLGVFDPRNPLKEMPFEFRLRMQKRKADKFVGNLNTHEYVTPERYKEIPVCDRVFFLTEFDAQNLGYKLKK